MESFTEEKLTWCSILKKNWPKYSWQVFKNTGFNGVQAVAGIHFQVEPSFLFLESFHTWDLEEWDSSRYHDEVFRIGKIEARTDVAYAMGWKYNTRKVLKSSKKWMNEASFFHNSNFWNWPENSNLNSVKYQQIWFSGVSEIKPQYDS